MLSLYTPLARGFEGAALESGAGFHGGFEKTGRGVKLPGHLELLLLGDGKGIVENREGRRVGVAGGGVRLPGRWRLIWIAHRCFP